MGQNAPITEDVSSPEKRARERERRQDGELVRRALAGEELAFGRLYDLWADRVFNLALRIVRDHDTAAEVSQDAFLAAWRNLADLGDQASFGGWLLRITRNRALDRIKGADRTRATDGEGLEMIERSGASPSSAPPGFGVESRLTRARDPELAVADGEVVALVQQTIAALGERDAEVLDLQLRYHLSPAEVGEVIGINRNAANQLCHRVRARFASAFGARMLWNGGRPACAELRLILDAAGVDRFSAAALPLATRHADRCRECGERRTARLAPSALFAAVPLVPLAGARRASMAHGLADAGVPMSGSTAGAGASSTGGGAGSSGGSGVRPGPASSAQASSSAGGGPPVDGSAASESNAPGQLARRAPAPRRVALVGLAMVVALVVALLVANAAAERTSDDGQEVLTRRAGSSPGPAAETTSTALRPPLSGTDPTMQEGTDAGARPPSTDPAPTTPPTAPPTTVAPTTIVAPPTIDRFDLGPNGSQPSGYQVGPGSPVLTWRVTGAAEVTVTSFYDDGVHGVRRNRIESTEASGRLPVCPGSVNAETSCLAPSGRYTYLIRATSADGAPVTSSEADPPGFDIRPVVID